MTTTTISTDDDLAADLAGVMNAARARRCSFGRMLDNLKPTVRTVVLDALNLDPRQGGLADPALSKMLNDHGRGYFPRGLLSDHRRGECVCTPTVSEAA